VADPTSKTVTSPATTVDALPTAPTKTGSTFAGWYTATSGGGTEFTATTTVTANITVYANWSINPVYTVTYDSQGGTAVAAQHVTLPAHTVGTLPTAPTKTGYTFGGWYTAISGGGTAFTATTAVTADITVYAKWTAIPGAFTQDDLTGTWHMNQLKTGGGKWGRAMFSINSSGNATFSSCLSSDGDTTCPSAGTVTMTINASGVITVSGSGDTDNHMTMTSNKNFAAGTATSGSSSNPNLMIIQKVVTGTSYSNADLQSKSFVYHQLKVGSNNEWEYGSGTTNGTGVVAPGNYTDPTGTYESGGGPGTISVSGDGVVTFSNDTAFSGFLSADKKTIVGTDTPNTGVHSLMIIQVTGQTYTAGYLPVGTMVGHMLAVGSSPAPFWVHFTITVASGGVITDSDWVASNSGITGNGTTDHGSISASGTVTIAGSDFHGQMSDDGKFMVGTQTLDTGVYSLIVTTK
jgi:uncharacterized repeat protein (TIGR02543 family)